MIFEGLTSWWAPWLLLATSACTIAALWMLWQRRFRAARLFAAGQVALILIGWFAAQYPYLIVPDVTTYASTTTTDTLRMLT